MMNSLVLLALALGLTTLFGPSAHALKLQIIHTNDLHSFFEGPRLATGGYARLKTMVEAIRENGRKQNAVTLFLDAGDFGEGSSFFMAEEGVTSLRMLDELGVDFSVLGNHDFMFGGKKLYDQITKAKLKTKILSANLRHKKWQGLKGIIKDMDVVDTEGLRIGIFGLTTNDSHYQYYIRDTGSIKDPLDDVGDLESKAKKLGVDYLIALTHIGLEVDKKLAEKSKAIDFIVGGHSHVALPEPVLAVNKKGQQVPIVQTGAYAVAVGEAFIDIDPKTKASKLLSYKLHEITKDVPRDEHIAHLTEEAKVSRNQILGRDYEEEIGSTTFDIGGYVAKSINAEDASCWSKKIVELTRQVTNTDISIHSEVLEGEGIPAGPIRYGDLIENYPHFSQFGDKGWDISTIRVNGFVLSQIINFVYLDKEKLKFYLSGVEVTHKNLIPYFKVNGKGINWLKYYSISVPSDLIAIFLHNYPWFKGILYRKVTRTDHHYWDLLEKYVRENSPLRCD